MGTLRLYLMLHRGWALWLVAAALLMKVAVPAGFMPAFVGGAIVVEPCSGFGVEPTSMPGMAMPGAADHHGKGAPARSGDMPCGFAGHASAPMAGTDPVLLVIAIAFIVATLFRVPVTRSVRQASFLRPPLRGPPAIA